MKTFLDFIIKLLCLPILRARGLVAVCSNDHEKMKGASKALVEFDAIRKRGFPSEILQASKNLAPAAESLSSVDLK